MGNQPSSATENLSSEPRNLDDTAPANVPPSSRLDTTQITRPQKKREGMALIQYRCRSSKAKYEKCVSDWYGNEFMKGDYANQEDACGDLFEMYKKCVLKGVRKEFWGNKKEKPKEGSFLSELEGDED